MLALVLALILPELYEVLLGPKEFKYEAHATTWPISRRAATCGSSLSLRLATWTVRVIQTNSAAEQRAHGGLARRVHKRSTIYKGHFER